MLETPKFSMLIMKSPQLQTLLNKMPQSAESLLGNGSWLVTLFNHECDVLEGVPSWYLQLLLQGKLLGFQLSFWSLIPNLKLGRILKVCLTATQIPIWFQTTVSGEIISLVYVVSSVTLSLGESYQLTLKYVTLWSPLCFHVSCICLYLCNNL